MIKINIRPFAFLLSAVPLLLPAACKKVEYQADVHDYFPKVATSSVRILPDGSAKVTGNVLAKGAGGITYVGFCMDTAPHPQMHFNQLLSDDLVGSTFTGTYSGLSAVRQYYVRAFAANAYGYAYGDDLVIEHAGLDTNTIACHPGANTMMVEEPGRTRNDYFTSYSVDVLDPIYHRFSATSSNYSYSLDFEFGKTPISGKYKIWEYTNFNSDLVKVLFNDPVRGSYYMNNGGELWVQQIDATRIRVWICHQDAALGRYITASLTTR